MRGAAPLDWRRFGRLVAEDPPGSNSLIVSIYGDVVWPHGGTLWIGSLIKVAEMFGINGRTVRTATHRLVRAGWLRPYRKGRKADYLLTPAGNEQCAEAAHRIYDKGHRHDWKGGWQMVVLPVLPEARRKQVWDELVWRGFTRIGTRVLLRPEGDDDIAAALQSLGLSDSAVLFDAASDSLEALAALSRDNWSLRELEKRYRAFLRSFGPVLRSVRKAVPPDDVALALRVCIVHRFRRILLKDPMLPARLLPAGWHGDEAYELCGEVYRILRRPSERYVAENLVAEGRPLPADYVAVGRRFSNRRHRTRSNR